MDICRWLLGLRLSWLLLILLLSPSFRSLLVSWIILSFLSRRTFIVPIRRSCTLLPGTLIPRIVIVLVLRRAWSSSLSHIWTIFLIILLIVAAVPRLLRVLVVLLLVLIPIAILRRSLSLRLTIVRSPRRFIGGVRIVRHSKHVFERHVPLFKESSSSHCPASMPAIRLNTRRCLRGTMCVEGLEQCQAERPICGGVSAAKVSGYPGIEVRRVSS